MKKVGRLVLYPDVCQVLFWYRDVAGFGAGAGAQTETETETQTPSCSQSDGPVLQEQSNAAIQSVLSAPFSKLLALSTVQSVKVLRRQGYM